MSMAFTLFMVHCQAAHRPDYTRVFERVALKLFKEFKGGRNRPKDPKGRSFAIPQAIVMTYGHIKQLIEDCQKVLQSTNLVLVTINNATVSSWLQDRQKRPTATLCFKGWSFLSRSTWQRNPSWRPWTYHLTRFHMGMQIWSSRNLTTVRVRR